jgi:hypothetical protein
MNISNFPPWYGNSPKTRHFPGLFFIAERRQGGRAQPRVCKSLQRWPHGKPGHFDAHASATACVKIVVAAMEQAPESGNVLICDGYARDHRIAALYRPVLAERRAQALLRGCTEIAVVLEPKHGSMLMNDGFVACLWMAIQGR